jgi:hypothetical protein
MRLGSALLVLVLGGVVVDRFVAAPAVEYDLPDAGKRKTRTAVCAAFCGTGFALSLPPRGQAVATTAD